MLSQAVTKCIFPPVKLDKLIYTDRPKACNQMVQMVKEIKMRLIVLFHVPRCYPFLFKSIF